MTNSHCETVRPLQEKSKRLYRRKYKRYTKGTYVGLLAYVIQSSPNKMLTFRQIMEKLCVFVSGDRKGLENNIRVCLSSNKCFVKVPVDPDYPSAKRNFWKVDESFITPKMLRRHFSDMKAMLPGLIPKWQGKCASGAVLDPPSPVAITKENCRPSKFSSSFSIESLLKKDHLRTPPVQHTQQHPALDRGGLSELRQTPTANSSVCRKDQFYNFTHPYYTYSSAVSVVYRVSEERKDLSAAHNHALCHPQVSYDQTVLSTLSNSPLFSHGLRYMRW